MFYLVDTNFELIKPLETFQSVIWTSRYYTAGDFELYMPASDEMLELLQKDRLIVNDKTFTQAMIIENIQVTTDIEEGNYIIVTGRDLKSILNRRIIFPQTTVTGTVEKCIRQLITNTIVNPTSTDRKIDNFILGTELGNTPEMSAQYTGDNLGETISNLCVTYKLGYDVSIDLDKKQFIFKLYKGTNRTSNQTEVPCVEFSNQFENLLNTDYKFSGENFKNIAIVAGEGEGAQRKNLTVGNASGLNRYELFVDAKSISSKSSNATLSDEEYNALLQEKGNERLNQNIIIENIEGEVETNGQYQFGKDYFLGDFVDVINEYGKTMRPQITEVIESEDDTGSTVIVTFATDTEEVE